MEIVEVKILCECSLYLESLDAKVSNVIKKKSFFEQTQCRIIIIKKKSTHTVERAFFLLTICQISN